MSWWAIDVRTPAEQRDSMGAWLVAQTGHAVEEREDGTLVAFAPDERSAEVLEAELGRQADQPVEIQRHRDRWHRLVHPLARRAGRQAYRAAHRHSFLAARSVGARPAHHRARPGDRVRQWGARLDSSRPHAAGPLPPPGDRVLDLGSGSGILAIAAIKLGAARRHRNRRRSRGQRGGRAERGAQRCGRAGRISRGRRGCTGSASGSGRSASLQYPALGQHRTLAGDLPNASSPCRGDFLRHGARGGRGVSPSVERCGLFGGAGSAGRGLVGSGGQAPAMRVVIQRAGLRAGGQRGSG